MRWNDLERSSHVEDRRGQRPLGGMTGKPGILVLLVVLVAGYYGVDLSGLLGTSELTSQRPAVTTSSAPQNHANDTLGDFTKVVLRQTETLWQNHFQRAGRSYQPPTLVLYSDSTSTACGAGNAAIGPFYCPRDQKLYIDLSFYNDMQKKLGGGGDFALGYVVAHEVGHHVQNLLGVSNLVHQKQQGESKKNANKLSVMLELQADCYAGVWGHSVRSQGRLEMGDLDEALSTATAIGDDRLQKMARGTIVPDSFTHGSSAERVFWFKRGFDTGDPA
ncbi:MAG: neutral zinc metallopeptidase, partial [Desulfovibrionaceae bacterium]|nr:neutral zinc metallopeptidase [Desulfovibrionaceae bacterium]